MQLSREHVSNIRCKTLLNKEAKCRATKKQPIKFTPNMHNRFKHRQSKKQKRKTVLSRGRSLPIERLKTAEVNNEIHVAQQQRYQP